MEPDFHGFHTHSKRVLFTLSSTCALLLFMLAILEASVEAKNAEACPYWHNCPAVLRHSDRSSLNSTVVVGIPSTTSHGNIKFQIHTFYENGTRNLYGGDSYWVRAEGLSVVHGTVTDHWNGTYTVALPLYDIGAYTVHVRRDYSRCDGTAVCKLHDLHLENAALPGSPFKVFVEKSALLWRKKQHHLHAHKERWILPSVFLNAKKRNDKRLGVTSEEFDALYAEEIAFLRAIQNTAYYDARGVYVPFDGDTSKVFLSPDGLRDKWFHFIGDSVMSHVFRTAANVMLAGYKVCKDDAVPLRLDPLSPISMASDVLQVHVACLEPPSESSDSEYSFDISKALQSDFEYDALDGCRRKGSESWCREPLSVHSLYFAAKPGQEHPSSYSAQLRGRRCLAPGEIAVMYFPELNFTISRRYVSGQNRPFLEYMDANRSTEYCLYGREVLGDEEMFTDLCMTDDGRDRTHPFYAGVRWCKKRRFNSEVVEITDAVVPLVLRSMPGRALRFPDALYMNYGLHHTAYTCGNADAYEFRVRSAVNEVQAVAPTPILFTFTTPVQFHMTDKGFVHKLHELSRCNTPYRAECLNQVVRRIAEEGVSHGKRYGLLNTYSIADPRVDSPRHNVHYERGSVYSAFAVSAMSELVRLSTASTSVSQSS